VPAHRINAVAVGVSQTGLLAVSAGDDSTLGIWDLTAKRLIERINGPENTTAFAVAVAECEGRLLAVSGWGDWTVRVHDVESAMAVGEPLRGHTPGCYITVVAVTELEGQTVLLSGDTVGTVRLWELASHRPLGEPLLGHSPGMPVFTLATGVVEGRTLLASGSRDGSVTMRDLGARRRLWGTETRRGAPDRDASVVGVALTRTAGTPMVACAYRDGILALRDLRTGDAVSYTQLPGFRALTGPSLQSAALLASAHDDGTVRYGEDGALTSGEARSDHGVINAIAFGHAQSDSDAFIVLGSNTGRVGAWNPRGGPHGIKWLTDAHGDGQVLEQHPLVKALGQRPVRVARGDRRTIPPST
jgi:WD40 repeat protein